jgi:proton-dependent oligopeptide transporter, POT family
MERSRFPGLFWTANIIEVLERFAYYGLYMGFGIYATKLASQGGLGWSKGQLGLVQSMFLVLSYAVPMLSGILADRYGFRIMLLTSYLLYLPGFLLLMVVDSFLMVWLVMALIAIAAGVFKPLIAGTVRLTCDDSNRTMGFGVFYLMVNVGAFFGPMTAGALRTMHWDYAFLSSAVATALMLIFTWLFYRNPIEVDQSARDTRPGEYLAEILQFVKAPKILVFIFIFGVFIEVPFWSFFNIVTMFVDNYVRTDLLYQGFASVLGTGFVDLFSTVDDEGVKRIAGETLGHTALYIIILQLAVTRTTERMRSVPAIAIGILIMLLGCIGLYFSVGPNPWMMFLGILLFAVGEMGCMPRFEQYLISLLPPEKTGLGGGLLRFPIAIGGLVSGLTITPLYGWYETKGSPETIWLVMGATLLVGFVLTLVYDKLFRHEG